MKARRRSAVNSEQQQLTTLPALDDYRRRFPSQFVTGVATDKPEHDKTDSHVELVTVNMTLPEASIEPNQQIAVCRIGSVVPLSVGTDPWLSGFEDVAIISLAIQHLNAGDGSIVPQVEGLNDRCPVRFTAEMVDSRVDKGESLSQVVEMMTRDEVTAEQKPKPCAFLGAYRSTVTIPTAIATGVFGYPQISASSTSPLLDDSIQYPFFARTVPGDDGNAVPVIIYMREVLKIDHLAVINVNDAYGSAYVEGLRSASYTYAPDLKIHQVPIDSVTMADNLTLAASAVVQSLKDCGYRYVFMLAFDIPIHDAIMLEAVKQGVAGTGKHNWMFGDSFNFITNRRVFGLGSPLQRAYQGAGYFQVTGGLVGDETKYDQFQAAVSKVNNPSDMAYIKSILPPDEQTEDYHQYLNDTAFLKSLTGAFGTFMYEATIALGLAACHASNNVGLNFTGQQHYESLLNTTFDGIGGIVRLNESTGTRLPDTSLLKLVNLQPKIELMDGDTGLEVVRFDEVVASLFHKGSWKELSPFLFNDNTTVIQPDLGLGESAASDDLVRLISITLAVSLFVVVVIVVIQELKRKKIDSVWMVDRAEVKFADPPEVIGRGNFGVVLSAEYKGTHVAVKRALPPVNNGLCCNRMEDNSSHGFWRRLSISSMEEDDASLFRNGDGHIHDDSTSTLAAVPDSPHTSQAALRRKRKRDFVHEMRLLAKLRHPCITTVMGAVITGEPMLILEFMDHGSLHDLLHNDTIVLEGDLVFPILGDITQGLRFLHSSNPQCIHGDLKAANILVDSRFRAKVADFGLSTKSPIGGTGTPYWMAPELLRRESVNTIASDAYAFGILLYEVFSRCDPYKGEDASEVLLLIADKTVQKRPVAPKSVPDQVVALMTDCFLDNPAARPPFEEIDTRLKRMDPEALGLCTSIGITKQKKGSVSLFDIFPRHIAEALRDGRKVQAEHKDIVTVFFSDIVGFTNIAGALEPQKVADMLDRLYTKLDALSEKHVVFKVETIGDAYMAVSNLVNDQADDHVARIAAFARDSIVAANETHIDIDAPEKGFIDLRCGFHSGPVVADVAGTRNPRYCLYGDTVNTASRMESHSAKNRIHCSITSASLLRKQNASFPLKSRGVTQIKGKGKMRTYWVNEGDSTTQRELKMLGKTSITHSEDDEAIVDVESLVPVRESFHESFTSKRISRRRNSAY